MTLALPLITDTTEVAPCYRGQTFTPAPPQPKMLGSRRGVYRGQAFAVSSGLVAPQLPTCYRGVWS